MCSIILDVGRGFVRIAANRDELVTRAWAPPAAHWPDHPGIIAGRDLSAGGTWLGLNAHGVMAAVLNRHGSLGPLPGKASRGELPLLALAETTAQAAAFRIASLDAGLYRSFNLVTADARGAWFARGLETGNPEVIPLGAGVWMITSGEPNETALPRIARHLPKFEAAPWQDWQALIADPTGPATTAINIPRQKSGFATVSSALITLDPTAATWRFAGGPPDQTAFVPVKLQSR